MSQAEPASPHVRLRRAAKRGAYDIEAALAVLDAGTIAHVAVETGRGPIVLPMAYGRTDDEIFVHGAAKNALLANAVDSDICITVTIVDALVFARTAFHNSMNYRCAVIRGMARDLQGAEKESTLVAISDHIVPTWSVGRLPTEEEVALTRVVAVPIVEVSTKVRTGDPIDKPADVSGPHWSGTVPVAQRYGTPVPAADLSEGIAVPDAIVELSG